eukprot:TRINITY_DN992_c0_g1_i1.p1 TRINITY_DN992_c0_g1~~TRINITY_DN992_c0_g1_i1.p1  ORF type:complete len:228 (-),score=62.06 TRINITY_DN992_c0_g1_i1:613-1296(-)
MQSDGFSFSGSHPSVAERRALVRQRQEAWKRQRMIERDREIVESELMSSEDSDASATQMDKQEEADDPHPPKRREVDKAQVLDRIADRLTDRLREELKLQLMDEQQRESMEKDRMHEKLERYLAAEIEGHTCPICFELMVPPINAPMLLFPCGHTFCDACLKRHEMERQRFLCPYCRAKVCECVHSHLQLTSHMHMCFLIASVSHVFFTACHIDCIESRECFSPTID